MMIRSRLSARPLWLLVAVIVVSGVSAQEPAPFARRGVPEDWTHHHILFSTEFLRNHPEVVAREPRALHQIYRRWGRLLSPNAGVTVNAAAQAGSSGDWAVQLGVGTTPIGASPAKFQTDPSAPPDCNKDFVVFGINANGVANTNPTQPGNGQATMIAFNQLYAGGLCNVGNSPAFLFAYNTSTLTNGRVRTSPVLSLDGKKIAFIESSAGGSAVHVLKIGTTGNNGGQGSGYLDPVTPGVGNNASMTTINYTTANNNHSSPWVDYDSDTLWVGDDGGKLYKVTGVFNGTPTLVSGGGWPVAVTGVFQITGPVFDSTSGNLFVGDGRGVLHSVNAATPGTVKSLQVGKPGQANPSILDAPIVDSYGNVFATSSNDGTSAVVVQADAVTLTQKARIRIGGGSTLASVNIYDGDFDDAYYNSQNTGHYVACGTGTNTAAPFRYRLAFAGGLLQSDLTPVRISTSTNSRCGPLTEYFNPNIGGGTDFFFWGVTNNCVGATGCIMKLANGSAVSTAAEPGGTSAIVIDNDSTQAQASSLYFATQAGRKAIKVTQSGLN